MKILVLFFLVYFVAADDGDIWVWQKSDFFENSARSDFQFSPEVESTPVVFPGQAERQVYADIPGRRLFGDEERPLPIQFPDLSGRNEQLERFVSGGDFPGRVSPRSGRSGGFRSFFNRFRDQENEESKSKTSKTRREPPPFRKSDDPEQEKGQVKSNIGLRGRILTPDRQRIHSSRVGKRENPIRKSAYVVPADISALPLESDSIRGPPGSPFSSPDPLHQKLSPHVSSPENIKTTPKQTLRQRPAKREIKKIKNQPGTNEGSRQRPSIQVPTRQKNIPDAARKPRKIPNQVIRNNIPQEKTNTPSFVVHNLPNPGQPLINVQENVKIRLPDRPIVSRPEVASKKPSVIPHVQIFPASPPPSVSVTEASHPESINSVAARTIEKLPPISHFEDLVSNTPVLQRPLAPEFHPPIQSFHVAPSHANTEVFPQVHPGLQTNLNLVPPTASKTVPSEKSQNAVVHKGTLIGSNRHQTNLNSFPIFHASPIQPSPKDNFRHNLPDGEYQFQPVVKPSSSEKFVRDNVNKAYSTVYSVDDSGQYHSGEDSLGFLLSSAGRSGYPPAQWDWAGHQ